jgi:hypothetical protein
MTSGTRPTALMYQHARQEREREIADAISARVESALKETVE